MNEAINHYRSNKRFELVEDDNYFEEGTNDFENSFEISEDSTLKETLAQIIEELPPGYQAVFKMYVFDNLTHKEIADYLGVTENTSKTQLSKARKMLKLETRRKEHNKQYNSIMSKEYENIDDLFKAELGGSVAKAPPHVKGKIDKAIGFGSSSKVLWILLPLIAISVALPFIFMTFGSNDFAQSSRIKKSNFISPNKNSNQTSNDNALVSYNANEVRENGLSTTANSTLEQPSNSTKSGSTVSSNQFSSSTSSVSVKNKEDQKKRKQN